MPRKCDHNERTGTENTINRKLDALRVAVSSLMFKATPGAGGVPDALRGLQEAWKEEEDGP